ncbi:hypothetical protein BDV41DRAFT_529371 [Aspergillus transmontanensis]|uniref:Uncharacterized protein n=1 Tax=Aspergillus transmontanensis TaxID=1034304 RepID=A0A5N6W5X6_9EURO|nr:hypothetical protein BDV41DRAFT_529371 [Aspergillus transmontanensis]
MLQMTVLDIAQNICSRNDVYLRISHGHDPVSAALDTVSRHSSFVLRPLDDRKRRTGQEDQT